MKAALGLSGGVLRRRVVWTRMESGSRRLSTSAGACGGGGNKGLSTSAGVQHECEDGEKGKIPRQLSGPQRSMIEGPQGAGLDSSWSAQQRTMVDRLFYAPVAQTEAQIRQDLQMAHRLLARYGFDDLVWNHVSARCIDDQTEDCCDLPSDTYLITPGGMHFSEIRSEDFVFDSVDEPGNIIHSGIYAARPDVRCVIHTHTLAIMTVSVLKQGFMFLTQDSAPFYKRIGYHDWEGLSCSDVEKDRIAASLGPDGIALIMRNHGATVVGRSIQEAFVRLYYLDRCCRVQVEAMKCGGEIIPCCEELLEHAGDQIERYFPHGKYEWAALTRLVENMR